MEIRLYFLPCQHRFLKMVLNQRRFLTHVFFREYKCNLWLFDTGFLVYNNCESILQNCPAGEAQLVRAWQCGNRLAVLGPALLVTGSTVL